MKTVIELIILIALNSLAFWQRGKNYNFLFVPAAAIDMIYGFLYAVSNSIPSTTFYEGLAIVILGLYCFFAEFLMKLFK